MLHILPYWHHGRCHGRKWYDMSSNPDAVNASYISSYLQYPSGSSRLMFYSPATSRFDTQGHSLSVVTTLSFVKVLSGAR